MKTQKEKFYKKTNSHKERIREIKREEILESEKAQMRENQKERKLERENQKVIEIKKVESMKKYNYLVRAKRRKWVTMGESPGKIGPACDFVRLSVVSAVHIPATTNTLSFGDAILLRLCILLQEFFTARAIRKEKEKSHEFF